MTQISLTVRGAELVRMGLQNLGAEIPKIGKGQIWNTTQEVIKRMRKYWTENVPPELPSYERTGTLARGYVSTPKTTGHPGYTISNPTEYTKYVVGNAYGIEQAWMHALPGRHTLLRDVVEEEVEKLPPAIVEEINMVARKEGLK